MEVTIEDNGLNDKDPAVGTVVDPAGIGLPAGAAFVDNRSSGSGGCAISAGPANPSRSGAWWMLAGFFAWLGWKRRKQQN